SSVACNFCKESLPAGALYCTHCNRSQDRIFVRCRFCQQEIPTGATHCSHCGRSQNLSVTRCPFCQEEIPVGAQYCIHCSRLTNSVWYRCKFCKEELPSGATYCRHCSRSQKSWLAHLPLSSSVIGAIALLVSVSSTLLTIIPNVWKSWQELYPKSELQFSLVDWADTTVKIAVSNKGNRVAALRALKFTSNVDLGVLFAAPSQDLVVAAPA